MRTLATDTPLAMDSFLTMRSNAGGGEELTIDDSQKQLKSRNQPQATRIKRELDESEGGWQESG